MVTITSKKEFAATLEGLNKHEISSKFGFNFSMSTIQFVKECDRAGLIGTIHHLIEVGSGSYLEGVKITAEKYPETFRCDYREEFSHFEYHYATDRQIKRYKTVCERWTVPSVWADLVFGAEWATENSL